MKINGITVKSYYKADGIITGYCKLSKAEINPNAQPQHYEWIYPNGEQPKPDDNPLLIFTKGKFTKYLHDIPQDNIDQIIEQKIND